MRYWLVMPMLVILAGCSTANQGWKPADGPLMTRWAKNVSPQNVHQEYPRPQMVRDDWLNLNGLWQYAIRPKNQPQPEQFDGKILVPFPIESALSGVMKTVGEPNTLWYRRDFAVPQKWQDKRVLLHFGASDWETTVWVNGNKMGTHRGGYDPFSFDITESLRPGRQQEIVVAVWDPTDAGNQPRGKQVARPHGIWYTSVTGIWQTVWLEVVNVAHIESLVIVPDIDGQLVRVTPKCSAQADGLAVEVEVKQNNKVVSNVSGKTSQEIILRITNPKLWSPDSPFLYDLRVTLLDGANKQADRVDGYFGMRKISLAKDGEGIKRLFLNNQPLFQFGPLDQGWWPDGLYTAPTDEALKHDIEVTKQLGFNMARKHVKVEPDRWYYWCDKLGLLVWQDMPSGDRYIGEKDPDFKRSDESAWQFEMELKNVIDALCNHPCIVMWVPFNEGWGQYDTVRIAKWIKQYDPTRLVDNASGWADRGAGDVHDIHIYPGPAAPANEPNRAAVLGEFGGLGLSLEEHTWQDAGGWGYRTLKTQQQLASGYAGLLEKLQPMVAKGLAAAVYTQTTDVETEVNGLMTYDRAIIKIDPQKMTELNHRLYADQAAK